MRLEQLHAWAQKVDRAGRSHPLRAEAEEALRQQALAVGVKPGAPSVLAQRARQEMKQLQRDIDKTVRVELHQEGLL